MKATTRSRSVAVLLAFCCAAWSMPAVADFDKAMEHFHKKEYVEVLRELEPLIKAHDGNALNMMGVMYANGQGVAKDERQAVEWYRKAADQGDATAQFNLGVMYDNGQGVSKDERLAVEWYRKAADQGNANAQFSLGVMYANGQGVAKDERQAVEWYRKAADQGDTNAQRNLGFMYESGKGVAKDERLAVSWYRRAADQGNATAQLNLGVMYDNGRGVAKDERQAVEWYRKAADQGDAIASNNLGFFFEGGSGGLRQDYVEAARLYEAAAIQGEPYSQRNLARMYREGLGVRSDAVVAYTWANLAASAESPHPNAADERGAMAQYMPKELVAEGQRLTREWKLGAPLGKSKLKPVTVAQLVAAQNIMKLGGALDARAAQERTNQFPARPEAKPGLVTCNTLCTNGDCFRTYGDGRKVRFQARQKWNPFNNQFEWDSGSC